MALVTGTYVRADGSPLPTGVQPRIEAIPSKNAVSVDGQAISVYPQTVTPNATTGAFTFDLIPTADVIQAGFHYIVRGYYLNPTGYGDSGHTQHDVFSLKLLVPIEGGSISDLALVQTAAGMAWEGPTPPPSSMLWLYVDPTYNPNSGAPLPAYTAPDGSTVEHGELVEWSA